MKGSAGKIQLASLDDFFGVSQGQNAGEPFQEIPLSDLHPFKGHPFHVTDDEKMEELAESVAQHGVLVPGIVRPKPEGGYELVSGHRRKRACELAGLATMPVIVRDLDDDEATLIMVDSNLQREKILPSEKAFAYRMKLEAMKRKAGRPSKDNSCPMGANLLGVRSDELLAGNSPDSARQIQRYIRLTYLLPPLLQIVDENKLVLRPAVEISYLTPEEQGLLLDIMGREMVVPTLEQAQQLKMYSQGGQLTETKILVVLAHKKPAAMQVTLKKDRLKQYFPQTYTQKQMEDVIFSLLDDWKSQQEGVGAGDENE